MTLPLATSTWNHDEIAAIEKVVASGMFTMGDKVAEFERKFAEYNGSKYCVMVNSGSSANLLAISALLHKDEGLRRGDEVIVSPVSWSTTYSALYFNGLKIKFVDIDLDTLNIDPKSLSSAITKDTRAVFLVNLLGNSHDFDSINEIARDKIIIEDNCESLGAEFKGQKTGSFGALGTFSFFFSHHISTMEGGAIVTDDEELYHILLSMRSHGWTRHLPPDNLVCQKGTNPFYESFRFVLPGYNLRPTELSGAVGLVQMRKIDEFLVHRRANYGYYHEVFQGDDRVKVQKEIGNSSAFALPFVLSSRYGRDDRDRIVARLLDAGIECRPIVAGNIVRNPVVEWFNYDVSGSLENANLVHDNGFFVANCHYPIREEINQVRDIIDGGLS